MPAAALTNVVSCFGKGCQPGTCAIGSAVYLIIPLRDDNDRDVKPVPAGGVRDVTALNLRANGQDAYSLGKDAYTTGSDVFSLGTDAFSLGTSKHALGISKHTLGTSVRQQPGYVEKRKGIPCSGCGCVKHSKNHKAKPGCPVYDNKRRRKEQP